MSAKAGIQIVECSMCGAKNRVQPDSSLEAICGRCKTPLLDQTNTTEPLVVTDRSFTRDVEESSLPVLLDLWAGWCKPCHMLAPVIDQLAKEYKGRARIAKLNIDENPNTAARFNVRSIPTMILFKNGKEIERIVGLYPKVEIQRRINAMI
jgi:thioredoxin